MPPPSVSSFAPLVVPHGLTAPAIVLDRHLSRASTELQGGQLREAAADFADALKRAPGFYPAETGLGDVALASQQYKEAVGHFDSALAVNGNYVPALLGQHRREPGRQG